MTRWIAALVVGAAMLGASTAVACGGDDDKTISDGRGGEINLSDDLPDDFPDDFPVYDGADLQGSYRGEAEGVVGVTVSWSTGGDVDDVRAFYDDELADGPWTSTSSGEFGESAFWQATNDDESKVAYIQVAGSDGDDTTILATIGDNDAGPTDGDDDTADDSDDSGNDDDSSGDDTDQPAAELPDEVDLSDDFPSDRVPFPDDVRVTSSSSFSGGGVKTYLVEMSSEDDVGTLADFFTRELEANGWTESFKTETDGEAFLTFTPDEGADASTESVTVTVSPSDVDGYSDVVIAVSLSE